MCLPWKDIKGENKDMTKNEYLSEYIIAYIGNKRRLVPLIEQAIEQTGVMNREENPTFFDVFAGSGIVSRLAKSMGFEVASNDWEYYSYIINKAFIELNESFLENSFLKLGGIDNVLDILNSLSGPKEEDAYISTYYCPEDDDDPDVINERMFYTNYNGKKIDAIRAKIDEWFEQNLIGDNEKTLLLALLLYEASTRSNTSGVFKGFHKGFGGTNGDALSRILKPITFKRPPLMNGKQSKVYNSDAVKLTGELKQKFNIAYLDPPYNQHQYGSNYHLLNTIARNDKPPVNKNIYINGKKTNKSAIRKDWVQTKSSFCYKKSAKDDFKKMIKNVKADYILISYSTDGIIEFDDMLNILADKGRLDITTSEYVKYRGGKQALTTQVRNIEFVLIVNTNEKCRKEDINNIKKTLLINKLNMFLKKTVNPIRAKNVGFDPIYSGITDYDMDKYYEKLYRNITISLGVNNNKISNYESVASKFFELPLDVLENVYVDLEYITNLTKEDEVYLAIDEINNFYRVHYFARAMEIFKEIPYNISKFNNKKAYIPALKSIIAVFEMMIQTVDMWRQLDIMNSSYFKRFEKLILKKLNHNVIKENFNVKNPEHLSQENMDMLREVDRYKNTISSQYEHLLNELEKEEVSVNDNANYDDLHVINYEHMPHTGVYNGISPVIN